jgi:16S rRNA (cytidine1402-2'-O)-methyltransferase
MSPPDDEIDPDILEELEQWTGHDDEEELEDEAALPMAGPSSGGALVLVGTPIGNLGDLSPRAVDALTHADIVYCEDTRHSRKLFTHAGIAGATLRSLHEHNEVERIDEVVAAVAGGRTVVVISDAGMPGISDPGSRVVAAVAAVGLTVTVVPGPSAVLAAVVASGLPTDRFCFEGFLPRSGKDRRLRLAGLAVEPRTTVLFEAPGRLAATLADLAEVCGEDRPVAVARELTKLHEEIWRGTAADSAGWAQGSTIRGEVVVVVGGAPVIEAEVDDALLVEALAARLDAGERTRGAVDAVATEFGVARRRVYDLALATRATRDTRLDEGR